MYMTHTYLMASIICTRQMPPSMVSSVCCMADTALGQSLEQCSVCCMADTALGQSLEQCSVHWCVSGQTCSVGVGYKPCWAEGEVLTDWHVMRRKCHRETSFPVLMFKFIFFLFPHSSKCYQSSEHVLCTPSRPHCLLWMRLHSVTSFC